jgi:hypothetical protein
MYLGAPRLSSAVLTKIIKGSRIFFEGSEPLFEPRFLRMPRPSSMHPLPRELRIHQRQAPPRAPLLGAFPAHGFAWGAGLDYLSAPLKASWSPRRAKWCARKFESDALFRRIALRGTQSPALVRRAR